MIALDVFLEGLEGPVGRLERADSGDTSFRYLRDDLPFPLSLSLPLRAAPFDDVATRGFFANLLFENEMRDQVMGRYGIAPSDFVGLLRYLGADCPGAISCVPVGEGPGKRPGDLAQDYDTIAYGDLIAILRSLRDERQLPEDTADPSPLAGIQGKIALTRMPDGGFALPRPGLRVPTTHILKIPQADEMFLVDQEQIGMSLMARLQDHPVAATEIFGEGDLRGLLIERYDRRVVGGAVTRLHQEDFCQALGLAPGQKHQRNGGTGWCFSAAAVGGLMARTDVPGANRLAFLRITLANLLLGNSDNHGKNHALLYGSGSRPRLAPVYDVVPDRTVPNRLAFDLGAAKMAEDLTAADLEALVRDLGFPRMTMRLRRMMETMLREAMAMIGEMSGPPRRPVGDAIAGQARHLARALGTDVAVTDRDLAIMTSPDQDQG